MRGEVDCGIIEIMVGPRQPFVILHLSDLHFGPHCRFKDLDEAKLETLAQRWPAR